MDLKRYQRDALDSLTRFLTLAGAKGPRKRSRQRSPTRSEKLGSKEGELSFVDTNRYLSFPIPLASACDSRPAGCGPADFEVLSFTPRIERSGSRNQFTSLRLLGELRSG